MFALAVATSHCTI